MPNASGSNKSRNIGFDISTISEGRDKGKVKVKGKTTGYSYLGDWTYLTPQESSGNGRLRHYINAKTGLTYAEEELLKQIPSAKGAGKEEKINQLSKLLILKTPTRFYDEKRNRVYDSSVLYENRWCNDFLKHGILKDSTGNPVTECPGNLNTLTIRNPKTNSNSNNTNNNNDSTPRAMGGRKTRVRRRVRKTRRR
jgi:hypothetical protein